MLWNDCVLYVTLQGKKFENGLFAPLNGIVGCLNSVDLAAFCGCGYCCS